MVLNDLFSLLAALCTIYSFLCVARIIMTWIPGLPYNVTSFFSKVCDPYLNFFSRRGIFQFGQIDFSPILSLGILSALTSLFNSFSRTGKISFAQILALIVSMTWNLISSILGFIILIFAIRLIVLLVQKNSYNGSDFWRRLDYTLNPFIYKIASPFSHGKMLPYKTALIVSLISLIAINIFGTLLMSVLINFINYIPF